MHLNVEPTHTFTYSTWPIMQERLYEFKGGKPKSVSRFYLFSASSC